MERWKFISHLAGFLGAAACGPAARCRWEQRFHYPVLGKGAQSVTPPPGSAASRGPRAYTPGHSPIFTMGRGLGGPHSKHHEGSSRGRRMEDSAALAPRSGWPHPYANLTFPLFQHYKPKDRISTGKYLLKAFSFIIYRF